MMMNKIKYIIVIIVLAVFCACEKQEVMLYENNPGVFFAFSTKMQTSEYSFLLNPGKEVDTVKIDVKVSGDTAGVDRYFYAEVLDSINTYALDGQYEVLNGVVPAGQVTGYLPVRLVRTLEMDTAIFSIELAIKESEEFSMTDFALGTHQLSYTSLVVKPRKWDRWCAKYYGPFSVNWFKFVLDVTKDPTLGTSNKTKVIYYSYQTMLKIALRAYNDSHEEPLKHDDGTLVVIP